MQDRSVLILYNDEEEVLMQHRREDRDVLPGYWGFFGGKIEEGESKEEALLREIREELQYTPQDPRFLTSYFVKREEGAMTLHVFVEHYDASQKLNQQEGQGMDWIDLDGMDNFKMPAHDKEILRKWRREQNKGD